MVISTSENSRMIGSAEKANSHSLMEVSRTATLKRIGTWAQKTLIDENEIIPLFLRLNISQN